MQYMHKNTQPPEVIALAGRAIRAHGRWHLIKIHVQENEALLILNALPDESPVNRDQNGAYDPAPSLEDLLKLAVRRVIQSGFKTPAPQILLPPGPCLSVSVRG